MTQISKSTLNFLRELKENNQRDWFNANKKRFVIAQEEFIVFVDALIQKIALFDPSIVHHTGKECVFRIYRDVRFSSDKSPYKTHFGAHVTSASKKSEIHTRAGYYIHLEPGASMLAGGAYMPEGTWLKQIRQEIAYNTKEFESILSHKDFIKYFGEMEGEQLKTSPRDFDADHPAIDLLRHKSFLATYKPSDSQILQADFLEHAAAVFKALYPFDSFLNRSRD